MGEINVQAAAMGTRILRTGIVAVLRSRDTKHYRAVVETLVEAGIDSVEFTLTTPTILDEFAALASDFRTRAAIGLGSVTNARLARAAIDVGADFVVTPSVVDGAGEACMAAQVPLYMGAFTPTEMTTAMRSGASAVKLFPASLAGVGYVREIRAPMPDILIMPSGGIAVADAGHWIAAGAVAVSLGGGLIGDALAGGSLDALRARCGVALGAVQAAREAAA